MTINIDSLTPIMAIVFGVLVLIFPKFLNYLIAVFLILSGLLGLGILKF